MSAATPSSGSWMLLDHTRSPHYLEFGGNPLLIPRRSRESCFPGVVDSRIYESPSRIAPGANVRRGPLPHSSDRDTRQLAGRSTYTEIGLPTTTPPRPHLTYSRSKSRQANHTPGCLPGGLPEACSRAYCACKLSKRCKIRPCVGANLNPMHRDGISGTFTARTSFDIYALPVSGL
jgi:hypothetical protein